MNTIRKLMMALAGMFFIYSILPTLWMRVFSKKVIKNTSEKGVLLTFDDGPNPSYTGKLLDLLQKHQVKAIFFVVASKAEKHPKLILRMQSEGHIIGIHHHTHRSNFIMTPFEVKKQLAESQRVLRQITGETIELYRPPYGHFNLAVPALAKDLKLMTWSGMFGDWRSKTAQTTLLNDLKTHANDGAIYVLHDCGVNFGANDLAPYYMLQALEQFLNEAEQWDISFVDAKNWFKNQEKK